MPRCSGSKPDGMPCERIVGASQEYCYRHDPARSSERHRAASRAAKSKPNREIQDIKMRLSELAQDVLEGSVDKGRAAVVSQVLNTYLRAGTVELRVAEQLEIVGRLESLEEDLRSRARSRTWGA
jgi:hypothetical protein